MSNYLFGIGIDKYSSCTKLSNPVRDINGIISILHSKYQFESDDTKLLLDEEATLRNIVNQFEFYCDRLTEADNIVCFFSGHGDYDEALELGYLIPQDAQVYEKHTYLPYSTIFNYIRAFKAHHTLLIADSCYSGSVFPLRSLIETAKDKLDRIPSKWAITSGRIEPVYDGQPGNNSPFAEALINIFKQNEETMLGVSELSNKIIIEVAGKLPQIPRGEPLQALGHKGGEFMFQIKHHSATPRRKIIKDDDLNELKELLSAYYETTQKKEEAENENKAGTIRRLEQELKSIEDLLDQELLKELENQKSTLSNSKMLESILGEKIIEQREQLRKIWEEKNIIVRQQKYEEAAKIRDVEKKLINEFPLREVNDKIIPNIKFDSDNIFIDYYLSLILIDYNRYSEKRAKTTSIENLFSKLLFNSLSFQYGFISNHIFKAKQKEITDKIKQC